MSAKVTLVTTDVAIVEMCREIFPEVFGQQWMCSTRIPTQLPSQKGLIVIDYTPGETALPDSFPPGELARYWFLLRRTDIPALQAIVGSADLNIVLKPLTRAAIRAFFIGAGLEGWQHQMEDSAGRAATLRVERDEILQFLIQANLKLQENDQDRNNFLARSVHDFRAPLTAISGYCGLLLEEQFGSLTPEQRNVLERMRYSVARLSRISNGMFQLTVPRRADRGLNLERADLQDCLDQAIHEVALLVKEKRISISTEIEQAPEGLLFERSQMEQTLVNLLENACKFTPREGTIKIEGYPYFWERRARESAPFDGSLERRITSSGEYNSFRVNIRDNGPGIPAAQVSRIFEEYTSYGGGQDRSGGGLGLAICRMILARHSGRIWAESHSSGALFSFVLPLRRAKLHGPAADTSTNLRSPVASAVEDCT